MVSSAQLLLGNLGFICTQRQHHQFRININKGQGPMTNTTILITEKIRLYLQCFNKRSDTAKTAVTKRCRKVLIPIPLFTVFMTKNKLGLIHKFAISVPTEIVKVVTGPQLLFETFMIYLFELNHR